jgi:hypothetical protein
MARTAKRFLSNMEFPEISEFPNNPSPGGIVFIGGVLYIYADLNGFATWFPVNRPQSSFVHSQGVASLVWTITHGMATNQLSVTLYDNNHEMLDASVQHLQDGNGNWYTTATLLSAEVGYAVVFGIENLSAPIMSAQVIEVTQAITIADKPVMVDEDVSTALDGLKAEFDAYAPV